MTNKRPVLVSWWPIRGLCWCWLWCCSWPVTLTVWRDTGGATMDQSQPGIWALDQWQPCNGDVTLWWLCTGSASGGLHTQSRRCCRQRRSWPPATIILTWPLPDPSSILDLSPDLTLTPPDMASWPLAPVKLAQWRPRDGGLFDPGGGPFDHGLGAAPRAAQWHGEGPAQVLHPHREPEQREQVIWPELHRHGERWSEIR